MGGGGGGGGCVGALPGATLSSPKMSAVTWVAVRLGVGGGGGGDCAGSYTVTTKMTMQEFGW